MHMNELPNQTRCDIVRDLGFLTLGSRLKRLGERLQAQTQDVLRDAGIEVPASHAPLLAALHRLGAMNVGGIANALGVSQPGVTRQLATLQSLGLVASTASAADGRQRTVSLTPSGSRLVARAKQKAWPRVEAAVVHACGPRGPDLLEQLAQVEAALESLTLLQRVPSHLGGRHHAGT